MENQLSANVLTYNSHFKSGGTTVGMFNVYVVLGSQNFLLESVETIHDQLGGSGIEGENCRAFFAIQLDNLELSIET